MEEEYRKRRQRTIIVFFIILLAVISVWSILTSPNPVGTIAVLAIVWFVSSWIIKRRHFIYAWSISEKPFRQYLKEHKSLVEEIQTEKLKYDVSSTLDSNDSHPLTEIEEQNWNNIVSSINLKDDKEK